MPRYTVCNEFVEFCGTELGVEHFQRVLLKFYTEKGYKICIDKSGKILKDYALIAKENDRIYQLWKLIVDKIVKNNQNKENKDLEEFFKPIGINDLLVEADAKRHIYIDVCRNSGGIDKKLLVSDIDDLKGHDYSGITPLERDDALDEFKKGGNINFGQGDNSTVTIYT